MNMSNDNEKNPTTDQQEDDPKAESAVRKYVEPKVVKTDNDLENITAHLGGFMSGSGSGGGFGFKRTRGMR